ncbi:hypothetical protein DFS34DRAFT_603286 [Phlyctochytrium arcticum]|nr:hypothetical protein DFS34DRAFT_603286 [Phlyctochytrium arcticum]
MNRRSNEEGVALLRDNQATPSTEARNVCNRAMDLARRRLHAPAKLSQLKHGKEFIDEKTLKELRSMGRRACVYGCLAACRKLNELADASIHRGEILEGRALMCQIMAVRLVRLITQEEGGKEELFCEVLTGQFDSVRGNHTTESALQVAVETDASIFINELPVQQCVEYIWRGIIIPQPPRAIEEDRLNHDGFIQVYCWPNEVKVGFAALPEGRLRVPMYQYAAETIFSFILLVVFTFVVNYRSVEMNPIEILMYLLVLSFTIAEIKQFWSQGSSFYFLTLFNCNDLISIVLFITAFTFRMIGVYRGSKDTLHGPIDASYDVLACNAVFLWTRGINTLAGFRYFGEMVVIIRSMLRDAAIFFVMFLFVLIGFVQAFAGLARDQPGEGPGFATGLYILAKAFLQAPDFGDAEKMHDVLGAPLLIFFQVLATVIMLNMLVAFFNQSYSKVVEAATQQHVVQFTLKVLGFFLLPTQYPFVPPINLIEVIALPLPRLCLSYNSYVSFLRWIWILAAFPINVIIATVENLYPEGTAANWTLVEDKERMEEEIDGEYARLYRGPAPVTAADVTTTTSSGSGSGESDTKLMKGNEVSVPDTFSMEKAVIQLLAEVRDLREEVRELRAES